MKKRQNNLFPKYNTRFIIMIAFVCILLFGGFSLINNFTTEVKAANNLEPSFKSVRITSKDTLWSIAKENYSEDYGSFDEYIEDIKRCNSLTSENINAGSSIIVPIYLPADFS